MCRGKNARYCFPIAFHRVVRNQNNVIVLTIFIFSSKLSFKNILKPHFQENQKCYVLIQANLGFPAECDVISVNIKMSKIFILRIFFAINCVFVCIKIIKKWFLCILVCIYAIYKSGAFTMLRLFCQTYWIWNIPRPQLPA